MVKDGNCKFRGLFIDSVSERFNCLNLKRKEKFWRLLYIVFTGKILFLGVHRVKCFVYPFYNWDTA